MYIILCYDVNVKRIAKVRKTCLKYLRYTQRSVYEGEMTQAKLKRLKSELKRIIDQENDEIVIYEMESVRFASKAKIGCTQNELFVL